MADKGTILLQSKGLWDLIDWEYLGYFRIFFFFPLSSSGKSETNNDRGKIGQLKKKKTTKAIHRWNLQYIRDDVQFIPPT